jgi:hypothetical protein
LKAVRECGKGCLCKVRHRCAAEVGEERCEQAEQGLDGYNKGEFPDPALPTYEHCSEWVEGEYTVRLSHTIDGHEVDPTTVQVLP